MFIAHSESGADSGSGTGKRRRQETFSVVYATSQAQTPVPDP
jgi:hypothetical protein